MHIDKGSLNQIPLVKLLITVFEKNISGVLYLKREGPEGALKILYFSRGKFYAAISSSDVDKLENILLAKKLVDEATLNKVNEEENISESKGKILVEKGIITLEKLIESTKEQFKNILLSVLKWEDGRFQFVEESPPEGLINLDINILNFIFNYITQYLEPDYIKKQMVSFQIKLIKNTNAEKVNKYYLNDKQKALLSRFNGLIPTDNILSSYPQEHRDSILKIIYFFFMSELIIREEIKPREKSILKEEADHPVYKEQKESLKQDEFVFGKKQKPKDEKPQKPDRLKFSKDKKAVTEKRKSKQFNYLIVFIILILILGGLIFIMLMNEDDIKEKAERTTRDNMVLVKEREPKVAMEKGEEIVVQMKKPSVQEENAQEKKDDMSGVREKPEPDKKPPDTLEPDSEMRVEKSAITYFKDRDFLKACGVWKKEISDSNVTHSILLELDCLKESVINAYNRIDNKNSFFILKRELNGRLCFLVFWGR
ncbi:MAG: DUF4388 domain-containing protein, partial [Candidatus Aminicenantes bacterium]|nr:DUF4388 domain-containing protein [Candidatus Aminicenantes bacterium]